MIENGHVTDFRQIFDHIPKTIIKEELRTNNNRITRLISDVRQFTLEEILIISSLLKADFIKTAHTAINQIVKEETGCSKKRKK